jgi:hypothetical protein
MPIVKSRFLCFIKRRLNKSAQKLAPLPRSYQRAVSALLVGLFVVMLALAAAKALHQSLHSQACEPGHNCAVTLLQSGQLEVADFQPALATPPTEIISLNLPLFRVIPHFLAELPPSCGPPAG